MLIAYLIIAILSVVLIFVLVAYSNLLNKHNALKDTSLLEDSAKGLAAKILDEAHAKAKKIIEEAEVLNKETGKKLTAALTKDAKAEVTRFRENLEGQVQVTKEALEKATSVEHDELKGELERYKAAKFQEIDAKARQVLATVTKQALGEAINNAQHAQLITRALEDAKQQGLL